MKRLEKVLNVSHIARLVMIGLRSDEERLILACQLGATDFNAGDIEDPVAAVLSP